MSKGILRKEVRLEKEKTFFNYGFRITKSKI